jgi:hypothetical protein
MNKNLRDYARKEIKEGLAKCTDAQVNLFKRMYSHKNLDRDINDIVDHMSEDSLDRAMEQVRQTLVKNGLV